MVSVGLVVKMVAKPETQDELAEFLTGALALANQEAGTEVWMALRTDASTFWIVDAFPSDTERQAHLNGPIAAALMENEGLSALVLCQPETIAWASGAFPGVATFWRRAGAASADGGRHRARPR